VVAVALFYCVIPAFCEHEKKPMCKRRFYNVEQVKHHTAWDFVKWLATRKRSRWPDRVRTEPCDPPPRQVSTGMIRYTVVGHSTVLIQADGVNILTDPIWSQRASMVSWAGPRRAVDPAIPFDKLPSIDAVLISHNHYDHMDIPTLKRLAAVHDPVFVAGLCNGRTLRRHGITRIVELGWWQEHECKGVRIIFTPARHFSGRGPFDYNRSLWGGFVMKVSGGTIYFAGDTGYGKHFKDIRDRLGPIDLAFIPIGAYDPAWMMETVHLSPSEAWQAHMDLDALVSVAIHFGTFQLTDEPIDEPVEKISTLARRNQGRGGIFVVPTFGKGVYLEELQ